MSICAARCVRFILFRQRYDHKRQRKDQTPSTLASQHVHFDRQSILSVAIVAAPPEAHRSIFLVGAEVMTIDDFDHRTFASTIYSLMLSINQPKRLPLPSAR